MTSRGWHELKKCAVNGAKIPKGDQVMGQPCPFCGNTLGAEMSATSPMQTKSTADGSTAVAPPSGSTTGSGMGSRMYEYKTVPLSIDEKFIGKTSARSESRVADALEDRLNGLSREGWELLVVADVVVAGKVMKSKERRTIPVAFFRRPVAS